MSESSPPGKSASPLVAKRFRLVLAVDFGDLDHRPSEICRRPGLAGRITVLGSPRRLIRAVVAPPPVDVDDPASVRGPACGSVIVAWRWLRLVGRNGRYASETMPSLRRSSCFHPALRRKSAGGAIFGLPAAQASPFIGLIDVAPSGYISRPRSL